MSLYILPLSGTRLLERLKMQVKKYNSFYTHIGVKLEYENNIFYIVNEKIWQVR